MVKYSVERPDTSGGPAQPSCSAKHLRVSLSVRKDSSMSQALKTDPAARERWVEELAESPAREQPPTTVSGRPIEPLYTPET